MTWQLPHRQQCWEALDVEDPILDQAKRLYELTQAADERIPWEWIARSVANRKKWRPGRWSPHLLLSAPADDPDRLTGFAVGAHVPGLGGYVSYLGVDPAARGAGIAGRLFEQLFRLFRVDAGTEGLPLPLVVWESRRPGPDAAESQKRNWNARIRSFAKTGAYWLAGATLLTPNYAALDEDEEAEPIPLEVFLVPIDESADSFTPARLREVIRSMYRGIYRLDPDTDPLALRTLAGMSNPALRPTLEALDRPISGQASAGQASVVEASSHPLLVSRLKRKPARLA